MIPKDTENRKKIIHYMLDAFDDKSNLTDWESNFIDSITQQFDDIGHLSDRQCEILERIYDKL